MLKAAQIAGLRRNGWRIDRSGLRDGRQQLTVAVALEESNGAALDLIALRNQAAPFGQNRFEHPRSIGDWLDRQACRCPGCLVNVCKQTLFRYFATDTLPGVGNERRLAHE